MSESNDRAATSGGSSLALRSVGLLVVGLGLLALLLALSGFEETMEQLRDADLTLIGLALLLFLSQGPTMALRWWLALRMCGHRVGLIACFRANCSSNVINFVAPGHFGEPIATAWLGRTGRGPGVESFAILVACKAAATVINMVFLLVCIGLLAIEVGGGQMIQAGTLALLSFVFTIFLFTSILHPGLAAWGTRLATSSTRRLLAWTDRRRDEGDKNPGLSTSEQAAQRVQSFFDRFRSAFTLFARRPAVLGMVSAISLLKIGTLVGTLHFIYRGLHVDISLVEATFLQAMDSLGNLAAIWIPGNLGVQEAVHTSAATGALQLESATGFSASVIFKALMLIYMTASALGFVVLSPLDPAPVE